jgi:SAM-dependent methyltransferase
MSQFDRFAPYYDLEFADFDDDLALYSGYAERAGGRLLELACGTGRLLLPLAAAGHELTGLDIAPAMLRVAERRLVAAGLHQRVELLLGDMRRPVGLAQRRYRLAFCAINSFLHLADQAAQLATLAAVRCHLEPGGRLILDLFHPHPAILADYDGRLLHEQSFTDAAGARIDKLVSRTLDAASQTIHTSFIYDRQAADGQLTRTVAPFTMRYIHRYELELLLAAAGFAIETLYGDYALHPFTADSPQLIVVAHPAPTA